MSTDFANAPIKEWARQYAAEGGEPFHAVLCDTPYEIGFMGKGWDNSGVAFDVATWQVIYDVLHPGAFMFVFGGSRTFHRMAVAIEDAGFVMHPTLVHIQGQGFPKATRVSSDGVDIPSFEGHRYGRQSLSPSAEFILCAQRPYDGRPVDNIVATGAGSLNIEKGRVATDDTWSGNKESAHDNYSADVYGDYGSQYAKPSNAAGRWPSNVVLSHSPDCTPSHCSAGCAVLELGEQSGESVSKAAARGGTSPNPMSWDNARTDGDIMAGVSDSGTAARYFFNADYCLEVAEQIEATDPMMYTPKADRWQREAGLFGEVGDSSIGDQRPSGSMSQRVHADEGRPDTLRRNTHSTVKPLALTHWLASLLLPPDTYAPRRLLVPFSGVASEVIGAMLAGWDHVQGVEIEAEYIDIAQQRVEFWQQYAGMDYKTARGLAEVKQEELERAARMNAPVDDLPLFRSASD